MAIPGFILAAMMLFAPDYKTVKTDGTGSNRGKAGPSATLKFILTNRTLVPIFLAQLPIVFYIDAATTWSTTYFMRTFAINVGYAAQIDRRYASRSKYRSFVMLSPSIIGERL